MSTFRVRAASLGEVSAQLQSVIAVFDGHVSTVNSQVNQVVGSSWIGEDQQAFQEQWTEWNTSAEAVRVALTGLSALLVQAEGSYTMTESGLTGNFAQSRQAQLQLVENVEEVEESVETGLERARAGEKQKARVAAVGMTTMRTGQNQATGDGKKPAAGAGEDVPE